MTLEQFTIQTFEDRIGESFAVEVDGAPPFDMNLEQVRPIPTSGWHPDDEAKRRKPFALQLLGPPGFVLPQRIYKFGHAELGDFECYRRL